MAEAEVIKLKIKGNFDYTKCVNAFPTNVKVKSIEELRKLAYENSKTRVAYSDSLGKVVMKVAYGNEYIRFDTDDKKSTAYVHEMDITAEEFEELEDHFWALLKSEVHSGKFDNEIVNISEKMILARKEAVK